MGIFLEHKEVKRIVESSEKAILFIHGIVGTPHHFDRFVYVVPDDISIYNLLLDGHGKGVRNFSRSSMKKWESQVQTAVDELASSHSQIYIAAHSMGTLFAIEQAVKSKRITKLFLLAVPLNLFLKPKMLSNSIKVFFNKIKPDDQAAKAAANCYGIERDWNIFHYIGWVPRYLELFRKINQTRNILDQLTTPCIAFQSSEDEMVSTKSSTTLSRNPAVSVIEIVNTFLKPYIIFPTHTAAEVLPCESCV